jgi:hypothetical protein
MFETDMPARLDRLTCASRAVRASVCAYSLTLTQFHAVAPERIGSFLWPFAAGNLLGPLLLGPLSIRSAAGRWSPPSAGRSRRSRRRSARGERGRPRHNAEPPPGAIRRSEGRPRK